MRILLWHGYLLGGTGSNVYTRQLAREWRERDTTSRSSCQDPQPERYDLGGATTVRPDVGGLLPVFVLDRYEGYEVRLVQDCTRAELDTWVEANAAAVRELLPADLVFTNHVLLGGPVGAATGAPFAVKAHGSELEYSMRGEPGAVGVGSGGARGRAGDVRRLGAHPRGARGRRAATSSRVHEVPPGVDVDALAARSRGRSRSPACSRRRAATRRTRATREERLPGRGQRRAARGVPRRRRARRSSTSAS